MDEIKRVGPPEAGGIQGSMYTWSVKLSGTPPQRWIDTFMHPGSYTIQVHPGLGRFEPGRFLFQSEEKNVPDWIKAIDQWIDTANKAVIAHAEEAVRQQVEATARRQDETRRMTEMNEKFKDL